MKILTPILAMFICSTSLWANTENENENEEVDPNRMGAYISFGVLGDFALRGYDGAEVSRDARMTYQVEVGNKFFAIPISFSGGQSVQIYGIKPRVQFLIPLVEDYFLAGPGLGLVYNYWHSSFVLGEGRVSTNISEFGTQLSLQAMIRPTSFLHILITPAAYDFNVWRYVGVGDGAKGRGNFSTTKSSVGVVYSAGLAAGVTF
jgi:hypothetical protein